MSWGTVGVDDLARKEVAPNSPKPTTNASTVPVATTSRSGLATATLKRRHPPAPSTAAASAWRGSRARMRGTRRRTTSGTAIVASTSGMASGEERRSSGGCRYARKKPKPSAAADMASGRNSAWSTIAPSRRPRATTAEAGTATAIAISVATSAFRVDAPNAPRGEVTPVVPVTGSRSDA